MSELACSPTDLKSTEKLNESIRMIPEAVLKKMSVL